jgi:predicted enzyme related to lactoylglutathione lyase
MLRSFSAVDWTRGVSFELISENPAGTASFLERVFGWSFRQSAWEGGTYCLASLAVPKVRVGVVGGAEGGIPSLRLPWITVTVAIPLERLLERIEEAGGERIEGPMEVRGQGRFLVFSDPWGCRFGAWEPLKF